MHPSKAFMPKKHVRKTRPARMVPVRTSDIPPWAQEVTPPERVELAVLFSWARYRPYLAETGQYAAYFNALAERAKQDFDARHDVLLELLDLVPGLLSPRWPWVLDGLRTLFWE